MKILLLACSYMAFYYVGKYLGYRKAEKDMKDKAAEFVAMHMTEEKKKSQSDLDA